MPRECTDHRKHSFPTTQEKTTHEHYQMVNTKIRLITFFVAKDEEALYSQEKTRPGADCGSDHELFIAKFRLKLKKLEKPPEHSYHLNQIPYDYTVEVTNRFKGLDLKDKVLEELWMEVHDIVQEAVIKTISRKRNAKRHKEICRYNAILNYL